MRVILPFPAASACAKAHLGSGARQSDAPGPVSAACLERRRVSPGLKQQLGFRRAEILSLPKPRPWSALAINERGTAMPFAQRKPLRLKQWDYSSPGMYFVTFCAYERKCILGSIPDEALDGVDAACSLSVLGEMCRQSAALAFKGKEAVSLDSFVIMPNHVHALVSLSGGEGSHKELGRRIASWKALTTKEARKAGLAGKPWQPGFHDHIVRNEADLARIREYMQNNPKQWQLDRYYC